MAPTLAPVIPIPAPATPDDRAQEWAVITGLTVPQMEYLAGMRASMDATWAASQ